MAVDHSQPSDAARSVAELLPTLAPDTLVQLRTLLTHHVEDPPPARDRELRLWLVVRLLSDGTGQTISQEAYEEARQLERERGREAISAAALNRTFGGWQTVLECATRLIFQGAGAKVPSNMHHARFVPAYLRIDVIDSLCEAREVLGDWPSQWEYEDWATLERKLARLHGNPDPRHPGLKPIRKLFGSYQAALQEAVDAWT